MTRRDRQADLGRQGDRAPGRARHRGRVRDRHLEAALPHRAHHARLRLHEHRRDRVGDHVHRRRRGHPALPRLRHRGARRAGTSVVPRDRVAADLRRAADPGRARRVQPPDPPAHAPARRREAVLRRLPQGRAPDGDARVGGQRARDLLPIERRPARSRARAAVDHPAAGEAADDRRVLVQEVDRPAVPLPRQLARPHRELPAHDVRGADRAVRGLAHGRARAEAAAHPARRPRAELLDVDGAARRIRRREPLRVDRGRHRRAVGPAARRREPGRDRDARADPRRVRRRRAASGRAGQGPERRLPPLGLRPPRVQELRPAGAHPQGDRRARAAGARLDATSSSTSRRSSSTSRSPTSTSSSASCTRTSTSTRASSTGRWASPPTCSRCCSRSAAFPGWIAHWIEGHENDKTKIGRPRQIYTGPLERKYVAIDQRT